MKKFRDYYPAEVSELSMSIISQTFSWAKADGVKVLEVTKEEYAYLADWFYAQLPWNWSGKTIWGIRLVIKEPENEMDKVTRQFLAKSLIDDIFDKPKPT